jgi:exodeoxyribonuclease VII small subunit
MSEHAQGNGPEPSFEEGLERLESIVRQLEEGELELEDSLALFEEGVALAQKLDQRLSHAETKVERLLRPDGSATAPLDDLLEEA